jgi:hypothetical protein
VAKSVGNCRRPVAAQLLGATQQERSRNNMSEMPLVLERQMRTALGRQLAAVYDETVQAPLPAPLRDLLAALRAEAERADPPPHK